MQLSDVAGHGTSAHNLAGPAVAVFTMTVLPDLLEYIDEFMQPIEFQSFC